jgi:cytochrome c oxidase cbb3-type subunit 3
MRSRRGAPGARALRAALAWLAAGAASAACEREERSFREWPPAAAAPAVRQSELQPGPPVRDAAVRSAYEESAYAASEGKRLFSQLNCVGCHSHGGGGIGPPLMDDEWIYGSEPENIFRTIVEGRPNGMPSFGGKLANAQVWQLVAYVRSMSGLLPKDVAPGRADDMQVRSQEQSAEKERPKDSSVPPSAERP